MERMEGKRMKSKVKQKDDNKIKEKRGNDNKTT